MQAAAAAQSLIRENRTGWLWARIFTPTGSLQNAEQGAQIRLIEGYLAGGKVVRTRPGAAGASANYYDITIVGATGIPQASRP